MIKPMRVKVFIIFLTFLMVVAALMVSIYNLVVQSEGSDIHSLSGKSRHFAVVVKDLNEDYVKKLMQGADAAAGKYNILMQYENLENLSVKEQANTIESLTASMVDGIITTGNESDLLAEAINKAAGKGIPVVTVRVDAPMSQRQSSVATNYFSAGVEAAYAVSDLLEKSACVGVITGKLDMLSVMGFKYAVDRFPGSTIKVIRSGESNPLKVVDQVKFLLSTYPEINIIYAAGIMETAAASRAVIDLNKVGKVWIVGFGDSAEIIRYIKKGIIRGSIVDPPYDMGYLSVKTLNEILEGKNVSYVNYVQISVITRENVVRYEEGKLLEGMRDDKK